MNMQKEVEEVNVRCFDERKATQAAAYLLKKSETHHIQDYIILAKLMYFSDRQALLTLGHSITKGQHYSLEDGPVVSEVNDLLRGGEHPNRYKSTGPWAEHISCTSADGARLLKDPKTDMLGDQEIEILDAVYREHGRKDTNRIKDEAHNLPEHIPPKRKGGREEITYTWLLERAGVDRTTASKIVRDNEIKDYVRSLIASVK
jgi:hypothetical protein